MNEVTQILSRLGAGEQAAANELLPIIYAELRALAAAKLALEPSGQTLQATALVHEAYIRLVDAAGDASWNGKRHFFGAAAEAMRRILIDRARQKRSAKAGGVFRRVAIDEIQLAADSDPHALLALDEVLQQLEACHPDCGELVRLRFFAGLSLKEAAEAMGVSRSTADRAWAFARAWLYKKLAEQD